MHRSKKYIFLITLLLFIQACGTTSSQTDNIEKTPSKTSKSMILDENNYIKISQYNYERFAILKNRQHLPANSKYRSYPGKDQSTSTKNLLQVSSTFNDQPNVDLLNIKQNNRVVVLRVDKNQKIVTIKYSDGKKSVEKDMTLDEFQNLGRGEMI